jgi:hypothetical protein
MISVSVIGPSEEAVALAALGNAAQSRFQFVNQGAGDAPHLVITESESFMPFWVGRRKGVFLSTCQSEGIAQYAGLPKEAYLLVWGLLGLMHWRALTLNPELIWEDFLVEEVAPGCLCAHRGSLQEYALAFDNAYICKGCRDFFLCVGAEPETLALQEALERIVRPKKM